MHTAKAFPGGLAAAALLFLAGLQSGCVASPSPSTPPSAVDSGFSVQAARGQALAERLCSTCHAIGPQDASPFAPAPPFREIVTRYPPEALAESLAEGIQVGHPAMPEFRLEPEEIDELLAYLRTLPPPGRADRARRLSTG